MAVRYRVTTLRKERDGYYYIVEPDGGGFGWEGWMRGSIHDVSRALDQRIRELERRARGEEGRWHGKTITAQTGDSRKR